MNAKEYDRVTAVRHTVSLLFRAPIIFPAPSPGFKLWEANRDVSGSDKNRYTSADHLEQIFWHSRAKAQIKYAAERDDRLRRFLVLPGIVPTLCFAGVMSRPITKTIRSHQGASGVSHDRRNLVCRPVLPRTPKYLRATTYDYHDGWVSKRPIHIVQWVSPTPQISGSDSARTRSGHGGLIEGSGSTIGLSALSTGHLKDLTGRIMCRGKDKGRGTSRNSPSTSSPPTTSSCTLSTFAHP